MKMKSERGQSAVEFILILPLVLLVVFSLAEFGTAFYTWITVNNATSEAARWASVAHIPDSTCSAAVQGIEWRAAQMSRGLLACGNVDVTYQIAYEDAASGHPSRGSAVSVHVARVYRPLTPLPALLNFVTLGLLPSTWPLEACSDARLEQRLPTGTYPLGSGACGA